MTTMTGRQDAASTTTVPMPTLGWALRRSLLGLVILFLAMGSIALLTYASIDPNLEEQPAEQSAEGQIVPISATGAVR